ncbi:proteinase-activated receptor 1 [Misgurnus anguillicaudatus]|uniref:proteinase-activated receptor 1 n=1 Tax=Misgurnus anguillicaudatus TaxID=75329 RepID=UPI003CCEFF2C
MEVKTILLLTLAAHTCIAAIFNVPNGRGFSVNIVYGTQTDEPIDYNDSLELPTNTRQGRRHSVMGVTEVPNENNNGRRLCNSTDPGGVKCNRTKPLVKKYIISKDAVLFLKSLLVTRVMPSFYILLFLVSFSLNALALVTFTCRIKTKKPAVIYMSNLACVDLLFTLLLPLKIHYHLNGSDWVFGEVACRGLSAAFYCYMYCSILLMMCMSVDRLVAVVFPIASLTWRNSRNSAYICALVWLMAIAGTVPILSITQTFKIENLGITCHEALLHEDHAEQTYMYLFSILSCVYFFLPLVITLACYSRIIYVLRVKCGQLASSSSSDKLRRAVIMTIATMIEFVVCFTPANAILLYHCVVLVTGGVSGEGNASYMAYMLAVCAGSSSVFLDPLLYYYGSSQCRQKISSVFWWKKAKATLSNSDSLTKCSHMSCEYSQARITVFGNKANDMLGK